MSYRLTIRMSEGEREEWQLAAGSDVPLSRFVKRVVADEVRRSRERGVSPARVAAAAGVPEGLVTGSAPISALGEAAAGVIVEGSPLVRPGDGARAAIAGLAAPAAEGARFERRCRNVSAHVPGKRCRFCGGER